MSYSLNRKVIYLAVIRASAVGVSLCLQIWLVATFGSAAYGGYIFFVTLCSLVTIVSKGGLDSLALRATAIGQSNNGLVPVFNSCVEGYVWRAFLFTSVCCLGLWGLYSLSIWYFPNVPVVSWQWIYATSLGVVVFQILIAMTRGAERSVLADVFDAIVRNGFMALGALALVAVHYISAESAIVAYASSFYLASLLLYRVTKKNLGVGSGQERALLGYDIKTHFGFMLSGLLSYVFFQMDTLVLGMYVDPAELGAYNMACNLVRAVIFIPMILMVLIQPRVAVAFTKGDTPSLINVAAMAIGLSFFAASLCSALLWVAGEQVLAWIDPGFLVATDAMHILSVAHIVNSILMIVGGVMAMTNHFWDTVRAQLAGCVVALMLYGVLIPKHGQVGAALAMFFGLLMVLAAYLFIYRRHLPKIYGFLLPQAK
jgi:O-antigen/teichoic acid export membrane protein